MWMQECDECATARTSGLHSWMRHLTENHVLPTEWPSERAARLTGPTSLRPYTTVTESKKKRRKDSVPRPLNSFMIFAQHIRRNVLRVFSDASNSVISQQLGDLWRNVSHEFRSRYDDEANRLVKIHQLEFPTYKYQPKKRQIPNNQVHHPQHSGSIPPNSGTGRESTMRLPQGQLSTDSNGSKQYLSCSIKESKPEYQRTSGRPSGTKQEDPVLRDTEAIKRMPQQMHVACGQKAATGCVTQNQTNIHSLSSVLPPLITPISKPMISANVEYIPQTSCDSAYASGISSSSSSSASSPVVGDLLSPLKPNSTGAGASPARRKIPFFPVRPQSQQLHCIGIVQPTRQRFLSAQNESTTNGNAHGTSPVFTNGPLCGRSNKPTAVYQSLSCELPTVHRLVTPVYVRLGPNSGTGNTEAVLLELPPGTTIIQPGNDLTGLKMHVLDLQQKEPAPTQLQRVVLTQPINQSTGLTMGQAQSLHMANTTHLDSNHFSPAPHSSCSPSSSCWSPSSGEVFFRQPTNSCAEVAAVSFPSSSVGEPTGLACDLDGCDVDMSDPIEIDMESSGLAVKHSQESDYYFERDANRTPNWTVSVADTIQPIYSNSDRLDSLATLDTKAAPDFDYLDMHTDNHSTSLNMEDTYDTSFDAMMNSIDINTLLPGAFPDGDNPLSDVSLVAHEFSDAPAIDDHASTGPQDSSADLVSSVIDVEEMLIKLDNPAVVVRNTRPTNTCNPNRSTYTSNRIDQTDMDFHLLGGPYSLGTSQQHSQLSDLDCLDKSCLFSGKSDWSFRVCD